MSYVDSGPPHWPSRRAQQSADNQDTLITAQLLQTLVRDRRQYLDEFVDGDGPYWISIGLFIDGERGVETTLERVIEFADESFETGRYLLRQLIERRFVQQYLSDAGEPAYRLSVPFSMQLRQYLSHQISHIRRAQGRLKEPKDIEEREES